MTVCSVTEVNLSSRSCTCTPMGGSTSSDLTNVQLMAEVDDGILLVPVIGSTVIVCHAERNVPYIALFSELQKIFLITVDGIQLQGGEFGGLIKIEDLVTKLNNLEQAFNDLVTKFNEHTHILTLTSGTGTAAPTVTQETTVLTETTREDIENDSITHGA